MGCWAWEWSAGAVKLLRWGKTEQLCGCWKDSDRLEHCLEKVRMAPLQAHPVSQALRCSLQATRPQPFPSLLGQSGC